MVEVPKVRELTLDDYSRLFDLWQVAGLQSLRPFGRDSHEAVAAQIASGVTTILGLEDGDRLVGAVVVTHDSRKGWINRLVVHPCFRRQGFARMLIEAAEDALHGRSIHVIGVLIEDFIRASLALFQSAVYSEGDPPVHYLSKRDSRAA
mgnify:CR=1 FL=1